MTDYEKGRRAGLLEAASIADARKGYGHGTRKSGAFKMNECAREIAEAIRAAATPVAPDLDAHHPSEHVAGTMFRAPALPLDPEAEKRCDDCFSASRLTTKTDHHGGMKTVCIDREACHARERANFERMQDERIAAREAEKRCPLCEKMRQGRAAFRSPCPDCGGTERGGR
jgi:hypothetical protein